MNVEEQREIGLGIIPTVNGYHLISNGFDRQQFSQKLMLYQLDQIDIHDNNPTLLYYKFN